MRWVVPATVSAAAALLVAAGLFVFISHATREVTVSCEIAPELPWELQGELVPGPYEVGIACVERTRYWWQDD